MNTSILYISYDGMTDPLGQSQVLPYLAGLSERGHRIVLLSCEKPQRYQVNKAKIEAFCEQHNIIWHPISYTASPPVLSTLKDVRNLNAKAAALHRQYSFDLVHCRSYIAALTGLRMKRLFETRLVFDMRGFWADERVDGGLWRLSNPLFKLIYRYFKQKEKEFLRKADSIVSLTHAGREQILKWDLGSIADINVIPCCVDTQLFDPVTIDPAIQKKLRQQANIPEDALVLGYVGSLGTWYLLPEMLTFYKEWLKQRPGTVLFFVTREPEDMILTEARKQNVPEENIRILGAGREAMPYYISMMDFGLFFLKQVFSKKASSPVKQGELMAMGVPVVCNSGVGDSDRIIQNYKAGVLVDHYSPEGYQKAITELLATDFDRAGIRSGCIDYFDLEKGVDTYDSIYRSLLK